MMSQIHFKWEKKGAEWYCMIPSVQQKEGESYRVDRSNSVNMYTYICIDIFWNDAHETIISCYLWIRDG